MRITSCDARMPNTWAWRCCRLRPTSSVEGKVQEALVLLIIFTVTVLAFDLAMSVLRGDVHCNARTAAIFRHCRRW